MKIVLATGIYPPAIGGPATYVANLARELVARGEEVVVVTYGGGPHFATSLASDVATRGEKWHVIRVSLAGGPFIRWMRYARALRKHAADADVVYAFSSVSCGIPLWLSGLKKPKRILRLGGDFLWERYTDRKGKAGLMQWYEKRRPLQGIMHRLLWTFDHIVFSTEFQECLYERVYRPLPNHSVIENALPDGEPKLHEIHHPLRILFLGRFVAFKNLTNLLRALARIPNATLTFVGKGPMGQPLRSLALELDIEERVAFLPPQYEMHKDTLFGTHDILVIPSKTEISPNAALEARAAGLPVLLTDQTGLSETLTRGMTVRSLLTPDAIVSAINEIVRDYASVASRAASEPQKRSWGMIAEEHRKLFLGMH